MHLAPAVRFEVKRTPFEGVVWLGMMLLVLLAGSLWALHDVVAWKLGLFYGVSFACLGWGVWVWAQPPQGVLAWNGQAWTWHDAAGEIPVVPHIRLDFQSVLLLQFAPGPRPAWVWLQQRMGDRSWIELRRALHGKGVRKTGVGNSVQDNGMPA
jgi:hypothetical protein